METGGGFVRHPLIAADLVTRREYQINIAFASRFDSTLVVLPTGMGKTVIALLIAAERLASLGEFGQKGKVLMLAPTKPLAGQHLGFFQKAMPSVDCALMTGETAPKKRAAIWEAATFIASTP
jgi:ERCC4-related helicase